MLKKTKSSPKPLAFAIVLLTLMTSAATVLLLDDRVMIPNDRGPVLKARTLSASYNSTFNITVIDEDGRPIGVPPVGNATVKIVGNTTKPSGWQTDGNGSVVITGILGDSTGIPYYLSIEATLGGFQTALRQVVAKENTTTNITIILVGGVILGKVSTAAMPSVAIAGATVYIPSLGPGYSNKTNSLGEYIMKGIPEGQTYTVFANASGFVGVPKIVSVPITGSVDFVLMSQTGSISGIVYDSSTHKGLNGTNVSVGIGNSVILVPTSANGSYQFTGVPPGTYTVTAARNGFYSNTTTGVTVTRENRTTLNFNLTEKPTLIHGAVRSGTLLLVEANISVVGTTLYSISGPDGTYEITNITPGTYTIRASRPGYVPAQFVEIIELGEDKELNINLTPVPGSILRGIVSAIVGNVKVPLVDVKVTLVTSNITQNSTSTNILGEFAFTGLVPGNYTVLFELANYRPMQVSGIAVSNSTTPSRQFLMTPLRHGFSGFIFGFDLPHSMMLLGLFLTAAILAVAVYLRIRAFQSPGSAPAVYDNVDDESDDRGSADGQGDLEDQLSESMGDRKESG